MLELKEMGVRARQAARTLATAGEAEKNAALEAVAAALEAHTPAILEANRQDVQAPPLQAPLRRCWTGSPFPTPA